MDWTNRETEAFIVHSKFHFQCKTCGKEWHTEGKKTGFVKSGAENHAGACLRRKQERDAALLTP